MPVHQMEMHLNVDVRCHKCGYAVTVRKGEWQETDEGWTYVLYVEPCKEEDCELNA